MAHLAGGRLRRKKYSTASEWSTSECPNRNGNAASTKRRFTGHAVLISMYTARNYSETAISTGKEKFGAETLKTLEYDDSR